LIENFRRAVIFGLAPDATVLAISSGMAIVSLAAAYGYFKTAEAAMADVI
jgi:hypothetical protein